MIGALLVPVGGIVVGTLFLGADMIAGAIVGAVERDKLEKKILENYIFLCILLCRPQEKDVHTYPIPGVVVECCVGI